MVSKKCVSCKETKNIEFFSKNKSSRDGYKSYCKKCASEQNKRYRQRHREKINERNKRWYYESKKVKEQRTQKEISKGYRVCTNCKIEKDIHEFYRRGNGGFYGECKKCHNAKSKLYHNDNRENILEKKREYYQENREYHLSYFKKYNIKNSKKNVERARMWVKNNPERARELAVMGVNRRRAKMKKLKSDFTRMDWIKCKDYFRDENGKIECAYCNKKMTNATQEHFIPIHKGGDHTAENILPICLSCNSKKSASDFYEWYPLMPFYKKENIERIHNYFNQLNQSDGNHEPSVPETVRRCND